MGFSKKVDIFAEEISLYIAIFRALNLPDDKLYQSTPKSGLNKKKFEKNYIIRHMKKIVYKDYSKIDNFTRCGYNYIKVKVDDKWMVWALTKDGYTFGYELWKRIRHINPDGKEIWRAPANEEFGRYGWYIYFRDTDACWKRMEEIKARSEQSERLICR